MCKAHQSSTSSFISGEIKLAIALRLLAGASYLELEILYAYGYSSIYCIFTKLQTTEYVKIKSLNLIVMII